ncbi:hypothetical protein HN935_00930 [archaeon]|jgi:hypothetical protein|nr:hypothetical protein [archaeon]
MVNKKVGLINPPCFFRGRSQKKGVGNIITMLISIVAVVIILLIFALGSYFVKWTDGQKSGVNVLDECEVGINNVFVYMRNFDELSVARKSIASGEDIDKVLERYERRRRGEYANLKDELAEILKTEIEFKGKEVDIQNAIVLQFRAYDGLVDRSFSDRSFLDYVVQNEGPGYIYKAGHTSETRFLHKDVDNLLDESRNLLVKIQGVLSTFSDKYIFEAPFGLITEGSVKFDSMKDFSSMVGFTGVVESSVNYGGKTYRIAYRRKSEC